MKFNFNVFVFNPARRPKEFPMLPFRIALFAAWIAVFGSFNPRSAWADSASVALVERPTSLPDMAIVQANAPITIVGYSSLTCAHCEHFWRQIFPNLRSKYIDTGKVRFVVREFPLDIKAMAASMLARCAANGDAPRYFEVIGALFQQQVGLIERTTVTLKAVGGTFGMNDDAFAACLKDNAMLDRLKADLAFANEDLKIRETPTFFINGEKPAAQFTMTVFDDFEAVLTPLLK
jgi:protein-disulfide isomerase